MALQFSMKPTGWFHIGWSGEIPVGAVKPMKYFGKDLVAFRAEDGELAVLDAHCHHLGAHLGYGGKVCGKAIACPYHGWQWDTQGKNSHIPSQDELVRKQLTKWHVVERFGMIFMWHDPAGGAPRDNMALPNLFTDFQELEATREEDFYPCWPDAVVSKFNEVIHPHMVLENLCDTAHFRHTHSAALDPVMRGFCVENNRFVSSMGFRSPKTKEVTLITHSLATGPSTAYFEFGGKFPYRLILAATPIDEDRTDFRVSYFFPRDPASPDVMPEHIRSYAASTDELFEEDARMWRRMKFKHRPIYAKQDVAGYSALRKWAEQFYEAPASLGPAMAAIMADDHR